MQAVPRLLAVVTAVPPYRLDQDDVVKRVKLLFGPSENLDRLLPVFTNTGIRTRYSCVPISWYDQAHGWAERNRIYLATAIDLLEAATRELLDRTGRDKSEIDSIVVVSTTGIALVFDPIETAGEQARLQQIRVGRTSISRNSNRPGSGMRTI